MKTGRPPEAASARAHDDVLGYLLKHAHYALEERTDSVLAGFGLTSRDLGVLRVIAADAAKSQQEVAGIIGVDRTTMVALLDALEKLGIVGRRPSDQDRRRNVVELTTSGRALFGRAEQASIQAELEFTAALGADGTLALRTALRRLLADAAL